MRLKLKRDTGDLIVGEMESDEGAGSPLIVAVAGDKEVRLKAKPRKGAKAEEGKSRSVVRVDENIFPGLTHANNLEIREAKSGAVLYRRAVVSQALEAKVFWYRLSPMPDEALERKAKRHFSAVHTAVERLPPHELSAWIRDSSARSVFITGRPRLRPHLD